METKNCPYCGEEILTAEKRCKHCGKWLDKAGEVNQKKLVECPFCAEKIEEDLEICPLCDESLTKEEVKTASFEPKEKIVEKKSTIKIIWSVITFIVAVLFLILLKTGVFGDLINNIFDSSQSSVNEEYSLNDGAEQSEQTQNNLITRTSIAGIEVIGKTPKEVKPNINNALTWEYIEEEDGQPEGYLIKDGEYDLLRFHIYNGEISAVEIYGSALSTADGLHVGSTAGDILKLYPKATVINAEFGEYTEINGIFYIFDSNWDKTVGDYSNSEHSSIVNKEIRIRSIMIIEQ
ncbi:MAG: hypothetical protein LBR10_14965 [Prevotellaceae bacterium]|nr:hypothetical protein [Prevotellaceae bacterium]